MQLLKELKRKDNLSIEEEAEWMEYFNQEKAHDYELKSRITQSDSEVDGMIF